MWEARTDGRPEVAHPLFLAVTVFPKNIQQLLKSYSHVALVLRRMIKTCVLRAKLLSSSIDEPQASTLPETEGKPISDQILKTGGLVAVRQNSKGLSY